MARPPASSTPAPANGDATPFRGRPGEGRGRGEASELDVEPEAPDDEPPSGSGRAEDEEPGSGRLEAADSEDNLFVLLDPGDTPMPRPKPTGPLVRVRAPEPDSAGSGSGGLSAYDGIFGELGGPAPARPEAPPPPPPPPPPPARPPVPDSERFERPLSTAGPVRPWQTGKLTQALQSEPVPVPSLGNVRRHDAQPSEPAPVDLDSSKLPRYEAPDRFRSVRDRLSGRAAATRRSGPWLVAAAAIVAAVGGGYAYRTYLAPPEPAPPVAVAPPAPPPAPAPVSTPTPAPDPLALARAIESRPVVPVAGPSPAEPDPSERRDWARLVPSRLAARVLGEKGSVVLFNGQEIFGRFVEIKEEKVAIGRDSGVVRIPLAEVEDIRLLHGRSVWDQALREREDAPAAPDPRPGQLRRELEAGAGGGP